MSVPVAGLFMDLDGTLADSMPVMRQVYFRFLDGLGATGSQAEFDSLVGLTLRDTVDHLREMHGLIQPPLELLLSYYGLVDEVYQSHAGLMPGAVELLAAARERGVFTAVVTSAQAGLARGFLANHGLERLVAAVVGADMVRRGKPDPGPYRLALDLAGVPPGRGLAVEDSPLGARSAIGAGIPTWIVGPPAQRPRVEGAAGYVARLDELVGRLDGGG